MNSTQLIATYEAISGITGRMVDAARNSDWDTLTELELNCRSLADSLMAAEPNPVLSSAHQQRKAEVIRKILADDAEVRKLTEPWMARLRLMLQNSGNERKLRRSYEQNHGNPDIS